MLTEKNRHRKKDRETLKENRQRQTALIIQYRERNTSKEKKNKSHTKNARERKPLKDRQRKEAIKHRKKNKTIQRYEYTYKEIEPWIEKLARGS